MKKIAIKKERIALNSHLLEVSYDPEKRLFGLAEYLQELSNWSASQTNQSTLILYQHHLYSVFFLHMFIVTC